MVSHLSLLREDVEVGELMHLLILLHYYMNEAVRKKIRKIKRWKLPAGPLALIACAISPDPFLRLIPLSCTVSLN